MRILAVLFLAVSLAAPCTGGTVRSLTDLPRPSVGLGALDDGSTGVWAVSAADPLGTNPTRVRQIFRWDPATGSVAQVTFFPEGVAEPPGSPALTPPAVVPSVSTSDDGQWLLFLSRGDPTGGNPDGSAELFLMRSDGSVLRQLTATSDVGGAISRFALSGDASRVVFLYDGVLTVPNPGRVPLAYVVEADGTGLRRLTSSTPAFGASWVSISDDGERASICESVPSGWFQVFAVDVTPGTSRALTNLEAYCRIAEISGDGSMVAFETSATGLPAGDFSDPACQGITQVAVVRWDGTSMKEVSGACACQGSVAPSLAYGPTLLDDGSWVFYGAEDCGWEIYKSRTDGSAKVRLTDSRVLPPDGCVFAVAPGGSGRIAFLCEGEPFWAIGGNPDGGRELHGTTQTGANPAGDARQLSSVRSGDSHGADVTPDGALVVFASNAQPDGAPASRADEIYRVSPGDGTPVAITALGRGRAFVPRLTDDGQTVVFVSDADPFDQDPVDVPALYAIATDGTALRRLTPPNVGIVAADLVGNGSVAVFSSYDPVPGGGAGVYRVALDGTGLARIAPPAEGLAVDATGTWVAYHDATSVRRARVDGSSPPEVLFTDASGLFTDRLSISGSGETIAFASWSNVLGTNPDRSFEVFVWEAATGTVRALTATSEGDHFAAVVSRNGAWVFAVSTAPYFEPSVPPEVVRIAVATGAVERVDGLRPSEPGFVEPDLDGRRAVFDGTGRASGGNGDGNREIFLIDRSARAGIAVSPGPAPTVVTWDVESGPATYDVIRGDVSALSLPGNGSVSLGAVSCLEDDSPDATTRGHEDPATPAPGEAWFFLYRGSAGSLAGAGSYGTGSGGGERLSASGDCAP